MFLSLNDVNFRPVGRDNTSTDVLSDQTALRRTGGAYRDRTDDLLNANQALSQLS